MKIVLSFKGPPLQGLSEARRAGVFFEWDFCSMLNTKLNVHAGFTPSAMVSSKRGNPEQEIRHLV